MGELSELKMAILNNSVEPRACNLSVLSVTSCRVSELVTILSSVTRMGIKQNSLPESKSWKTFVMEFLVKLVLLFCIVMEYIAINIVESRC
jgi:hypothetical protein